MAKSALLSGTPLELIRMKISETVSTSRSSARPMMPICAFLIPSRWARLPSRTRPSTSGLRSRYSRAKESGESELKNSLMSGIHCGFLAITGVRVANSSVIGASGFSVGSVGPDLIWSEAERLRRTALVDPRQAAYTRSPRVQGHPMIVRPGVAQTLAGQANHHRDPPLTASLRTGCVTAVRQALPAADKRGAGARYARLERYPAVRRDAATHGKPGRALNRSNLRWFETSPCRAVPEGQTSIINTTPRLSARPPTSHPPAAFVAHNRPRNGPTPRRRGRPRPGRTRARRCWPAAGK